MVVRRYTNLRATLRKKAKGRGRGLTDTTLERLEDKYHVDLTRHYGEEKSLKNVDRIIKKISAHNPKRRRRIITRKRGVKR